MKWRKVEKINTNILRDKTQPSFIITFHLFSFVIMVITISVHVQDVPKLSALGYLTIFCSLDSQKDFRGQNIISTGKEHFWVKGPEGSGYL